MHCSIARTFGVLGDAWSALVIRDVFVGLRRFDALVEDLGISRKVLTERLALLQESGLLRARRYQRNPPRFEYELTAAGNELVPPLLALLAWGDRWRAPDGPPAVVRHRGHRCRAKVVCGTCGEALRAKELTAQPGPGGRRAPGTRLLFERTVPAVPRATASAPAAWRGSAARRMPDEAQLARGLARERRPANA
jgi:DNA-binding HxlR family transcriptional regulator